ncbi:MAG: adenylate/guanylate cyclase domain-containing protein [Bacteroidales bacterium]
MSSVRHEQFKSFLLQVSISGVLTGIFTFLFFQNHWLVFLLGIVIGIQVYSYIYLYETILKPRIRYLNFLLIILINAFMYVLIIIFSVLVGMFIITGFNLQFILQNYQEIVVSKTMLYGLIFGFVLSFFFSSYSMFDTLLGKNFLLKIFTGQYHRPFEEERVFMFLDIKSSTTIAEQLGHKKFLSLLNDFFYDLAEPVTATSGEIYKYVGDEAIISWKWKHAGTAKPLQCFFLLEQRIENNREKYLKKFGQVPGFKAAIHGGTVVTGEMGFIKKEIAFLGDVLNTTSRIESKCNEFGKNLIVSDVTLQAMNPGAGFEIQSLGEVVLRGKQQAMAVSAVTSKQQTENMDLIREPLAKT